MTCRDILNVKNIFFGVSVVLPKKDKEKNLDNMPKVKRGFTFNDMLVRRPNFSKHNLSHDTIRSLASGKLTPLWWTKCVPGDYLNCNLSSFVRLLALSSPMLQREDIFVRAFKVPERILFNQEDLDAYYAGDKTGTHPDKPLVTCVPDYMDIGSLYDYLGLPLPFEFNSGTKSWSKISNTTNDPDVVITPFLAYHRIFHDHFRNEETMDEFADLFKQRFSDLDGSTSHATFSTLASVPDSVGSFTLDHLWNVCWERDYLTSALASTQRGNQITIPLLGTALVKPSSDQLPQLNNTIPGAQSPLELYQLPNGQLTTDDTGESDPLSWKKSGLVVDGSEFSGIGAIALRMAMNLQAFLEKNNIAGYRMIGNILAHFGVQSSNKLMDQAEYLGGIKAPITISAVNQTSATETNGTPQGTQVGTAQASFSGHLFKTFCEEPCIIMVVGYINAKSSYSQGLSRFWTTYKWTDEYWPEFQTIGEQEILNQEVMWDYLQDPHATTNRNIDTWAYQSRYSEYKYIPDDIAGDFRTTLSYWHQSRLFASRPAFNNDFVKSNPSDRVFALSSETYPRPYLCEFFFDCQAVRPMDKYATSKLW